jgi:deoxyribodipyrimidine photo-lyase
MQAGVTHRGSRAWTRIYHPGQVAVERCDPQGLFIRRWLPELASLTNDQLGAPPPMADYPRPVLDYERARRQRLEALAARRPPQTSALESMARLAENLTPFGHQRFPEAVVGWAQQRDAGLFPAAVDLDALQGPQRADLLSWFVIQGPGRQASPPSNTRRRRSKPEAPGQLSLDLSL